MSTLFIPPGTMSSGIVDTLEPPKNPEANTRFNVYHVFVLIPNKPEDQKLHLDAGSGSLELTSQMDVLDLLLVSEPTLSAIWMTPEEDEAWKNL